MSKKYIYDVEGIESGFVPGAGEVIDGRIETDVPLTGHNFTLVEPEADAATTLQATEPNQPSDPVPSQPINELGA